MENKRNWSALAAFICSLVPIVPAAFFAWICLSPSTWSGPNEVGIAGFFLVLFCGFVTAVVMMGMGIISSVLGTIAIRKPEPRDKTLATVALILGILEIVTALLLPIYYFSR